MEWIHISELRPRKGQRVLIGYYGETMEAAYLRDNQFERFGNKVAATYWAKMPKPPTE